MVTSRGFGPVEALFLFDPASGGGRPALLVGAEAGVAASADAGARSPIRPSRRRSTVIILVLFSLGATAPPARIRGAAPCDFAALRRLPHLCAVTFALLVP